MGAIVKFGSELEFEAYIRDIIATQITAANPEIYALKNKKAVDILICRDGPSPALFFIEVKLHQISHGRLGFGNSTGGGFQPEILTKKSLYFEQNLRWTLASEFEEPGKVLFVPNEMIRRYVAGGSVGNKFSNIQQKIIREGRWLTGEQFVTNLKDWVGCK